MSSKPVIVSQDMTPVHLRANRSAFAMWFGRTILRVLGWRVEGEIPNLERILIIGAPHTSNWDFVYAMAAILALNIKLRWLGKHTIFKPGVTWFMEWLGGIPVNRSKPESIVDNVARLVEKDKGIVIGLAPEGTRKKVETWKTGFLRIAEAIDCKILLSVWIFRASALCLISCLNRPVITMRILQRCRHFIVATRLNIQINFRWL